jgi:hypothetical protein
MPRPREINQLEPQSHVFTIQIRADQNSAERRKNAAQGASRGGKSSNDTALEGRKNN